MNATTRETTAPVDRRAPARWSRVLRSRGWLKLIRLLAVLFMISVLTFLSLQLLPGDPARVILGDQANDPATLAAMRHELGLDQGILARYLDWIGGALSGDLGSSYVTKETVSSMISSRLPITLELVILSQLIALVLAIPAGIVAAINKGRGADHAIGLWVFGVLSTPNFVIGVILIWIFAVTLGWLPANGYQPWSEGVGAHLGSVILASISLAAAPFALYQRVLRADYAETLGRDFIDVARAKGISPLRIVFRHAIRPSILGLLTVTGLTVGVLIGSTVVVENLFGLPGLGAGLVSAVQNRDYIVVQGMTLVIACSFVLINTLVDFLYGVVDPRLRGATAGNREG
ncbi:ABC transporter permease [Nocardioides sp. LHD-245]|uniref:ABC transporter permease n=1 Tax=Nocardioides sp. LHD-245 TaxID=3051387 RepID=UPI0027E1F957|nr:ABC transporter permease [Nocardioides sp. LHD-245]